MSLPSVVDEVQRLFEELVHKPWASVSLVPASVRETADGWIVELPSQGLRAGEIRVQAQGRVLTVSGTKRASQHAEHPRRWSSAQVAFQRSIPLPEAAVGASVDAKVEGDKVIVHLQRRRHK